MTIQETIRNYAAQKVNRTHGYSRWNGGNVFSDERVIYSYGHHFPMAYRLGEIDGKPVHLLNGDVYSSSTSSHQADVRSACPGFTIPFSALRAAGFYPADLTLADVVDRTDDESIPLTRETTESPWKRDDDDTPFVHPGAGMIHVYTHGDPPGLTASFHAPGAVLLRKSNESRLAELGATMLCTRDEGQYAIIEVRGQPTSIAQAFDELQPEAVRVAKAAGLDVLRQGEWFFIPAARPKGQASKARQVRLPRRNDTGNLHVVRQIQTPDETLCTGTVYHRSPVTNRATRQHRKLELGDGWYTAHRNTEVNSWTAGGKVD